MSNGRARKSIPVDLTEPYSQEEYEERISVLHDLRVQGVKVLTATLAEVVARSGLSRSTVQRDITRGGRPAGRPGRPACSEEFLIQIVLSGSVAAAQAAWARDGKDARHRRVEQLAFEELDKAMRVALVDGEGKATDFDLRVLQDIVTPNSVWFVDFFWLRRRVLTDNGRGTRGAWGMVIADGASGVVAVPTVVRADFKDDPTDREGLTSIDALHGVACAMAGRPGSPLHGRPKLLVHDNQGCLTAKDFYGALADPFIDVACRTARPYEKRDNGRAERAVRSVRQRLYSPVQERALIDIDDRHILHPDAEEDPLADAVPLKDLIEEVGQAVEQVNAMPHRHHRQLTKAEYYEQTLEEPRNISRELTSRFMRRAGRVPVTSTGATLERDDYLAVENPAAMRRLVGRQVEVRYWDTDTSEVELWRAGRFVCTAKNVRGLSEEEKERVYEDTARAQEARRELQVRAVEKERARMADRRQAAMAAAPAAPSIDRYDPDQEMAEEI